MLYSLCWLPAAFCSPAACPGAAVGHRRIPRAFSPVSGTAGWPPLSLIFGLFRPHIRVYEVANTGWWYDFGFYLAIVGGWGSLSLVRKKSK